MAWHTDADTDAEAPAPIRPSMGLLADVPIGYKNCVYRLDIRIVYTDWFTYDDSYVNTPIDISIITVNNSALNGPASQPIDTD
jgi:hypothetical protein